MFNPNSIYTNELYDPKAIYLTKDNFNIANDGKTDCTKVIQEAINKVQETVKYGIVFIPEGEYLISETIYVWKGIRLIGYGKKRPTFILGENTPGFQTNINKYMIHFVSDRPPVGKPIRDANPGTFYSAISNINIIIKDGNPSAVAIRSHFAQHCFLSNIDFHIGSGKAGVEQVGNEIDNCRFFGGDYGIITTKPSPSWPFLLINSYFTGQRKAAIETEEGGFTIVGNHFHHVPTAIKIRDNRDEELWLTESILEDISRPAIIISDENNARTQINLKDVYCDNVDTLAYFKPSNKEINSPESRYLITDFCHGNQITDLGQMPDIKTTFAYESITDLPDVLLADLPKLPACDSWINITTLGAIGDNETDNTKVIQDAINKYNVLYFPTGRYVVSDTIFLKNDTILIGLSPIATQIVLKDRTPEFHKPGPPKPLLESSHGGNNIITGIGLDTGGINNRAMAVKWMAGTNSLMDDVKIIGGHGTYYPDGSPVPVYNNSRTADGNPERSWDSQFWSIWITNNGGGTFKNIWTASPYAQGGIYISDTSTKGRIYGISIEHHVRNEIKLENVSNWQIYDLQTEAEKGESANCLPLYINNCHHITFANVYLYRVIWMETRYPYGIKTKNSTNLEFRGVHVYSPSKYTFSDTLYDETTDEYIRSREIARLCITGNKPKKIIKKDNIEKLIGGFHYIDGLSIDNENNIYFVDSKYHSIYKWSKDLQLICDAPINPQALVFDESNSLIITTKTGTVYTCNPTDSINTLMVLEPTTHYGKISVHPGHRFRDGHDFLDVVMKKSEENYVSPDKSVYLPKNDDLLRAHTLRKAQINKPFFVADEFAQKTYSFFINPDGQLSNFKLFAEEGEIDTAVDSKGNVYIAAGYIFVYDKNGKQIKIIDVPERPTGIIIINNYLYVTANTSLYKILIPLQ